jgi:hypothetical protein
METPVTDDDDWLPFQFAVDKIKAALGVSRGKAQSILRQVCSTGEIRSQKQPYSIVNREWHWEGPPELIAPHEWLDHEIDLVPDSDGCDYHVSVETSDFRYWLKDRRKRPSGGKQARIHAQLDKMFPDGVPDDYPRKGLKNDLIKRDPTLVPLDEATLKKAIDTFNADPNRNRLHSD